MERGEHIFRTAVVGGFNRQDVLDYIEAATRENREKAATLQKELQALRAERETLRQEKAALEQQAEALRKETDKLRKTGTDRGAELGQVQAELVREREQREALQRELDGYKAQCARWEDGAKAYDDLKDRTATIELEARQRARAIESAAEEKARKLRTEAEQILYKVQAGYGRLRGDVDATITHASGELGRVDKALEQVRSEFAEHDASLEKLLQSCREVSRKVPEPIPLEEK